MATTGRGKTTHRGATMKCMRAFSLALLCLVLLLFSVGCPKSETQRQETDTTAPSTPSNLTKTSADSDNTPTFAWSPANDIDTGVAYYLVRIDSGPFVNIGSDLSYTVLTTLIEGSHTFEVKAVDSAYNQGTSTSLTFVCVSTDATPPLISGISVTATSTSSAAVTWTTNEPATGQVEYGTTASYGLPTTLDTNLVTSHSASLSGINASTTYHYRVKSKDGAGNEAVSGDFSFTTAALPDTNPESQLRTFLEQNFGTLNTSLGPTTFSFNINHNTSITYPYDYWIQVEYDLTFFYDLQYSNTISTEMNHTVCQELKDHQERLAKAVINLMPGKKFYGGYYHGWYTYPSIQVGYNARRYYSWVNYQPPSFFTGYEDAKVSGFSWWTDIDDTLAR